MLINVFRSVDKNDNRIDHNPELETSDDNQNLSAEIVENNPSPSNVVEVAESIPNEQVPVQTQNYAAPQNQIFAPVPAVQNFGYGKNYNPYAQAYEYGLSLNQIAEVGVSLDAARDLNKQMLSNTLNLQKKYYDNLETERHAEALQQINLNQKFALSVQNIVKDDDGNFIKPPKIDWRTMIASFIFKNMLVFERINGLKIIWKKDSENNRHIAIDDDELKMNFIEFVEDQCENFYASEAELNRAFKTLKYKIPPLKKSDLTILAETQLPFANGYLDIKSGKFTAMTPDDRHFNQFAMPYDYNPLAKNPDAFDEMLADMFANDEAKIHLAYQLIGAIISSVSTLKRIYSNSAKYED